MSIDVETIRDELDVFGVDAPEVESDLWTKGEISSLFCCISCVKLSD